MLPRNMKTVLPYSVCVSSKDSSEDLSFAVVWTCHGMYHQSWYVAASFDSEKSAYEALKMVLAAYYRPELLPTEKLFKVKRRMMNFSRPGSGPSPHESALDVLDYHHLFDGEDLAICYLLLDEKEI